MSEQKRIRQTKAQASAILSSDLHIRPDTPIGRTDNYFAAMEKKIDFILALSKQHSCPILIAGDLGNKPLNAGWPTWLLEWAINKFKRHEIICIPGQHDLPNHQIEQFEKSGMGVLTAAGAIKTIGIIKDEDEIINYETENFVIIPFPYGSKMTNFKSNIKPLIVMTHQPILFGKSMFEGIQGIELLKQFPEYNLILSGDNHLPFVVEYESRKLVNPGSMMRNTTDQADHKPRVYLWWAKTNEVDPVYLPIETDVISREHIDISNERNDRFDALIMRVKNDVEIKLSYESNIENYFQKYRTEIPVKEKIWRAVV